jgi:hypothetical protein
MGGKEFVKRNRDYFTEAAYDYLFNFYNRHGGIGAMWICDQWIELAPQIALAAKLTEADLSEEEEDNIIKVMQEFKRAGFYVAWLPQSQTFLIRL